MLQLAPFAKFIPASPNDPNISPREIKASASDERKWLGPEDDEDSSVPNCYGDEGTDDDEDTDIGFSGLIEVEPSVYSDIVITGAHGNIWEVANSVVILTMCILVQLAFAVIMGQCLAENEVADKIDTETQFGSVNLYHEWTKSTTAAGGSVCQWGITRSWWVCQAKKWGYEAEKVKQMEEYTADVSIFHLNLKMDKGTFFGLVAIFVWLGYMLKEFKSILSYLRLMWLPCLHDHTHDYTYNRRTGEGHLHGLCIPVKVIVLLTAAARCVICYFLTVNGCKFLSYTEELKDFILNSVALAFVYDLDELFFQIFLSSHKKHRVNTLQPPEFHVIQCSPFISRLFNTLMESVGIVLALLLTWYFSEDLIQFGKEFGGEAYNSICQDALDISTASEAAAAGSMFACTGGDTSPNKINAL